MEDADKCGAIILPFYMQSYSGKRGERERITFIFDNGHSIEVNKVNDKISAIDGFPAEIAGQLNNRADNNIEYYSRIYEVNGSDFIYDMSGISSVIIDKNGKPSDYDYLEDNCKTLKDALEHFSKDNYIGKLTYSGTGILPNNADMYLSSDGSIPVIWKYDSDSDNLPAKYPNASQETVDKLYYAAMLTQID